MFDREEAEDGSGEDGENEEEGKEAEHKKFYRADLPIPILYKGTLQDLMHEMMKEQTMADFIGTDSLFIFNDSHYYFE